jgi:hypothetical protein
MSAAERSWKYATRLVPPPARIWKIGGKSTLVWPLAIVFSLVANAQKQLPDMSHTGKDLILVQMNHAITIAADGHRN